MATLVKNTSVQAGSIHSHGGASVPSGYLLCDGSSVSRTTYPILFSSIGTAYGFADGTHFNLPDLRGRFLRGVNAGSGNDPDTSSRTANAANGNTGDNVGTLQTDAFQQHTHQFFLAFDVQGGNNVGGTVPQSQGFSSTTGATGNTSTETRPKNVYVNYIIKF